MSVNGKDFVLKNITSAIIVCIAIIFFMTIEVYKFSETVKEGKGVASILMTSMTTILLKVYIGMFVFSRLFLKIIQYILFFLLARVISKEYVKYIGTNHIHESLTFGLTDFIFVATSFMFIYALLLMYGIAFKTKKEVVKNDDQVVFDDDLEWSMQYMDKETVFLHYKLMLFTCITFLILFYLFSIWIRIIYTK